MKTIKFRAQGDVDGIWVYGNLFKNECCTRIISGITIIDGDNRILGEITTVNPKTVGQLTGLTDKNGKEIYEGDIVKYRDTTSFVVWSLDGWEFNSYMELGGNRFYTYFDRTRGDKHEIGEVIGNIHMNPELLES